MRIFALAGLMLALCGPAMAEGEPPRIAVLPFDSALGRAYDGYREALPDIVTACFTRIAPDVAILDRSAVESIAAEAANDFDLRKIKLQSATHLLRGSLAPHDDGMAVTLLVYDLARAKLVASGAASGQADAAAVCRAVSSLAGPLRLAVGGVADAGGSVPDERGQLMFEGLGYYYSGAYEKAVPVFMKLAKAEPENALARYWLGKSYQQAGMADEARIEFETYLKQFPRDASRAEIEGYLKKETGK